MNAKIIFDTTEAKSGIYEIVLPASEPNPAPQTLHIMIDVSSAGMFSPDVHHGRKVPFISFT